MIELMLDTLLSTDVQVGTAGMLETDSKSSLAVLCSWASTDTGLDPTAVLSRSRLLEELSRKLVSVEDCESLPLITVDVLS